jgi:hypothetical protein
MQKHPGFVVVALKNRKPLQYKLLQGLFRVLEKVFYIFGVVESSRSQISDFTIVRIWSVLFIWSSMSYTSPGFFQP